MGHAGQVIPYSEMQKLYLEDPRKFSFSPPQAPPPPSPQLFESPDPSDLQKITPDPREPTIEPIIEQPPEHPQKSSPQIQQLLFKS